MNNIQAWERKICKLEHWQILAICLMVCDFLTVHLSYFLALWLRFDCVYSAIEQRFLNPYIHFITLYSLGAVVLFWFLRMYKSMWQYASYEELVRTFIGSATTSLLHAILITVILARMPLSYYIWGAILQLILLLVPRFSYRLLLFIHSGLKHSDENAGRVMIIGAGQAGLMLLRDLNTAKELHDKAVCFIDDNSNKWGRFIEGVPIVEGHEDIF